MDRRPSSSRRNSLEDERDGRDAGPRRSLTGDELLAAVTEAMVALHQRYPRREPGSAKTLLLVGDLLACVLGGVYTDVEKTTIELQQTVVVHHTRSAFQNGMQHRFIAASERLAATPADDEQLWRLTAGGWAARGEHPGRA